MDQEIITESLIDLTKLQVFYCIDCKIFLNHSFAPIISHPVC